MYSFDVVDALRFGHSAAVFTGPIVRRPQAAAVSGGGDDRLRAAQPGQPQGEGIGTAQMAGQKRHTKRRMVLYPI